MCFQLVFPVKVQNILMWEKLIKVLDHVKKFGTLSKKELSLVTSTFFTGYISIITKMLVQLFHLSGYWSREKMSLELDDYLNKF